MLPIRASIAGSSGINVVAIPVYQSSAISDSTPTLLEMTYDLSLANIVPATSAFAVLVNGASRAVNSVAISDTKVQLTLASAVIYGDIITVAYTKPVSNPIQVASGGQAVSISAQNVTNSVLYAMTLATVGTGAGVSTLRMSVSSNITATLTGTARFYTDAGGTANESTTWNLTSGAERTIYLKCPTDTPLMKFSDPTKIINIGNGVDGWVSGTNAARLTIPTAALTTLLQLRINGTSTITGQLPTSLQILSLGNTTTWTYSSALPSGLTYLLLSGSLSWTYNGVLPTGLTYLRLNGDNIAWTYSGALPAGVASLLLVGANINWTYDGTLPTGLTYINISGANINWTGLNVGNNGNIATFLLSNYRSAKMSSADMVTLLTQMKNRTGSLPATVTVNDFADYASPPQAVTDAVAALKTAKSITTVNLGA